MWNNQREVVCINDPLSSSVTTKSSNEKTKLNILFAITAHSNNY